MRNFPVKQESAYLITDRNTRKYFCGVDIAEGYLIVTEHLTVFTDARYFYSANKLLTSAGVGCKLFNGLDSISNFFTENKISTLYIDFERATVKEYFDYKNLGLEVLDGSLDIQKIKAIKDSFELESIKKACEIVQTAYHKVIKTVKVGMSEFELKDLLEKEMIKLGAEETSFETIVAFGENSAVPHHETGKTVLTENSVILIDAGCKVNGYCSDITRTAFFGTPDKKFIDCYNAVLKANLIAEENITDGTSVKDADNFARSFLSEQNLSKYFTHSLGHGVGQEIHEYPRLSPKGEGTLQNGMVFTVEPGVYFDGEFGIRIEDTVTLKNGKVERLFTDDKKLIIIEKK